MRILQFLSHHGAAGALNPIPWAKGTMTVSCPHVRVALTPCQGIFQLLTSVSHTDLSPSLISNTPSSTVPTLQPEHLALHLLWCPGGSPCAGPLQLFPRFPGSLGERDSPIEWVTEQDLNSALETLRHWPRLAGKPSTA